jgi:L-2,4-diaminobutyric acid acetyltransferase
MLKNASTYQIYKVKVDDIKDVYKLLTANRPYVGLNSRYTYLLLAKDFSDTCIIAKIGSKIIGFSSGYVPPKRPDTFFNWEIVVDEKYRGNGIQKAMLIHQIHITSAKFLELTINPSNDVCRKSIIDLARLLHTTYEESMLFSERDFGNDEHEPEVLFRVGPMSPTDVKSLRDSLNEKMADAH